jgi:hypothetical protein
MPAGWTFPKRQLKCDMTRPKEWHSVLDAEVRRWSPMPWEKLVSALRDLHTYEVEFDSKTYQVEVELLENTEKHPHVMVAVDDGRLPASLSPLTQSFVHEKLPPNGVALV